jgi:hypothetical protein
MLTADPAYEAFAAGISGNDDVDIIGNWCCGEAHQPCTNFPIVQGAFAPATTFGDMTAEDNTGGYSVDRFWL